MTSMKIIQFLRPLTPPLVHLRSKIFQALDIGGLISNELSQSSNDNQSAKIKHNPRMTIICYQVLFPGWLSFSVSTH